MSYAGSKLVYKCDHPKCPAKFDFLLSPEETKGDGADLLKRALVAMVRMVAEAEDAGWAVTGADGHLCEIHRPGGERSGVVVPMKPAGVES